ncbi:hypothetical protein LOB49_10360 [Lactobacillus delbrueckii subsp. lactis]|nr:hypothetical protein [Lactobacillus delbrueckii]MCD5538210.1 hypothetical protein [Lactobacillus delbrueckii subsp. lactis]
MQEAGDATLPLSKGKGQTAACTFVLLGDKAEGWKNDSLTALLLLAGTGHFRAGQQKWQVKPGDWFLMAAGQDCKASLKEGLLVQLVLPEAFSGSLSNLTDACQEILHMFDEGTKQNTSV